MNKKIKAIISILLVIISVFAAASCARYKPSSVPVTNDWEYAEMTIRESTLTNAGLSYIIENTSEAYTISFGADYGLEKKIDGEWYEMPLVLGGRRDVIGISYSVLPGGSGEWHADWSERHGKLKAGEYRLIKPVTIFVTETHLLSVEFTID